MTTKEAKDRNDVPLLGTPGYEEYIEEQGQQAMDRALAMPLVRVFFGVLFGCFAFLCFDQLAELPGFITPRQWRTVLESAGFVLALVICMLDIGSVCIFGRSGTPWYRAIARRFSAKS